MNDDFVPKCSYHVFDHINNAEFSNKKHVNMRNLRINLRILKGIKCKSAKHATKTFCIMAFMPHYFHRGY